MLQVLDVLGREGHANGCTFTLFSNRARCVLGFFSMRPPHVVNEIERYQFECHRRTIRDRPKHAQNTHTGKQAAGAQSLSPSPVGDGAGGDFVDSPDLAAEEVGHSSK